MSDDTSRRRSTRRPNLARPIEHGALGRPTRGQTLHHTPITPDEWADIIRLARDQRTEEAITEYARKRTA